MKMVSPFAQKAAKDAVVIMMTATLVAEVDADFAAAVNTILCVEF